MKVITIYHHEWKSEGRPQKVSVVAQDEHGTLGHTLAEATQTNGVWIYRKHGKTGVSRNFIHKRDLIRFLKMRHPTAKESFAWK